MLIPSSRACLGFRYLNLATLEQDATAVFGVRTTEDFHQSRLACAILAKQDVYLAFAQFEVHVIQCDNARKRLANSLHLECESVWKHVFQSGHPGAPGLARQRNPEPEVWTIWSRIWSAAAWRRFLSVSNCPCERKAVTSHRTPKFAPGWSLALPGTTCQVLPRP